MSSFSSPSSPLHQQRVVTKEGTNGCSGVGGGVGGLEEVGQTASVTLKERGAEAARLY